MRDSAEGGQINNRNRVPIWIAEYGVFAATDIERRDDNAVASLLVVPTELRHVINQETHVRVWQRRVGMKHNFSIAFRKHQADHPALFIAPHLTQSKDVLIKIGGLIEVRHTVHNAINFPKLLHDCYSLTLH